MIRFDVDRASMVALERSIAKKQKILLSQVTVKKSLKRGAQVTRDVAKRLVTVKTGKLKDSIKVVESGSVEVVADQPYATVSEYKDRPYMRPAMKETTKIRQAISNEYKKNI